MVKVKLFNLNNTNLEQEINDFLKEVIYIDYKTCNKFVHIIYNEFDSSISRRMVLEEDLIKCEDKLLIEKYFKN